MKRHWLALVTVFTLCILLVGCGHSHEWSDATCDTPKTCISCGETEGEALGHDWCEATCQESKHCSRCNATEGEPLPHEWVEATCQEAKHCMTCGHTQGGLAKHIWEDATCTTAKTCTVCKKTDGEPLGHSVAEWTTTTEASCSAEGLRVGICETCHKECGKIIEKLPHTPGDWQIKEDYIFYPDGSVAPGTEEIVCTVCNEEIDTREYTVELTLSQKNAVIRAYDEIEFWHCGSYFLIHTILVDFDDFPLEDARLAVEHMDVDWDEQAILYAQQNSSGESKAGLQEMMRYYGFSTEQIAKALEEIGY